MYAIVNKVLSDIGYIKPSDSTGTLSQEMRLVSKKSGEYKPVTVYTDPLTGKKIAPDVGWSHNPASGFSEGWSEA